VCPVTAAYTTAPGSAAPGDYTSTFGTVTFAAGTAHQAAQALNEMI
jgi:hypothetical protein